MMHRDTGRHIDEAVLHIRQSITDILTTAIGTRVMRRTYGSLVPRLLDQPDNGLTTLRLYAAITSALHRWEPRIRLRKINVVRKPERPGQADITLECSMQTGDASAAQPLTLEVQI